MCSWYIVLKHALKRMELCMVQPFMLQRVAFANQPFMRECSNIMEGWLNSHLQWDKKLTKDLLTETLTV